MKVAQVTLRFDAPGGVETFVREVSRRMHDRGTDVHVFSSDLFDEAHWERRTDFRPEVDGVPVRRFPVYKRLIPGLTLPLIPGLMDALREWEPDVIHAHSHRYGHVLQSAILARARRTPLIVSMHYHPADRREPAWKVGMLRVQDVGFGMSAYRVARFLVVESQHEARLVAAFAPARRIRIISPGIDLESWRSEPREAPEHLPESYVLYAGRIASNKGLSTLFEAYALLPPSTRLPLVVMGPDWGERPTLQAHAERLGLRHDVVWVDPARDQRTYRRVFFGARLFVLPSEYEAFGLVLLEAMAAGIPILASRVGAVPEVLENGASGRLVDYGDPAGLAQGMQAVLTDPQVARGLVARASQRVESFTWERTVDQLESLYREVTGAT